MRITLESTEQIVMLDTGEGVAVPARVWQGTAGCGTTCFAFITMIAPRISLEDEAAHAAFAAGLDDNVPLWPDVEAWLHGAHFGRPQ